MCQLLALFHLQIIADEFVELRLQHCHQPPFCTLSSPLVVTSTELRCGVACSAPTVYDAAAQPASCGRCGTG